MLTTTQKTYTVKDYKQLEEGDPHQLINGALVVCEPAPAYGHQGILRDIIKQILNHLDQNQLGEVIFAPLDVYFDDKNVLQPDIIFVSNERNSIIKEDGIHGAPDVIIEITSPSTAKFDHIIKKRIYEKSGVTEYWIINPSHEEAVGFKIIDKKYVEFCRSYGKFTSEVLNLEISIKL